MSEQSVSTKRITWIDAAKGLLILFVIFGHVTTSADVKNYLSSFYMPAFFILSGQTMCPTLKGSLKSHLLKRTTALLGPYLLFSICWIVFSCMKQLIAPSDFLPLSALVSIVLPYSGWANGNVYIYWFLPCMFWAQLIFSLVLYLSKKKKLFGGLLWVTLGIIGVCINNGHLLICIVMATVFIAVGYALRRIRGGGGQALGGYR